MHQRCQGPFRGVRGKLGFFSRHHSRKGPHLSLRGESPSFSQVAAGNLGFLPSYDGDLKDPLVWPQVRPVSMRVARGLLGFLSSWCQALGPHLEMRPQPQAYSPLLTWILVFLCSFHRGVKPRLMWRHATLLSSRAVTVVPGFLSS